MYIFVGHTIYGASSPLGRFGLRKSLIKAALNSQR